MSDYRYKSSKKIRKRKTIVFIIFSVIIVMLTTTVAVFDKRLFPAVIEIAHINAQNKLNVAISNSLDNVTEEMKLSSSDFYIKGLDNENKINSLTANTLLINEVCSRLAEDLSTELIQMEVEEVSIPIGILFGINFLGASGPSYTIKILPKGNAAVDYETLFDSAGINQINFQIWVKVTAKIQIINPITNNEIVVNRKISLVNTIINGEVPSAMITPYRE